MKATCPRLNTYLELDTLFHLKIMQASRNQLAMTVVNAIHSHARVRERFSELPADLLEELLHLTQEGHTAILERLTERDAAGAESAMRAHIQSTWTWRRRNPGVDAPRHASTEATGQAEPPKCRQTVTIQADRRQLIRRTTAPPQSPKAAYSHVSEFFGGVRVNRDHALALAGHEVRAPEVGQFG